MKKIIRSILKFFRHIGAFFDKWLITPITKLILKVVDIYKSNDKNKRFGYNFIFVVKYKIKDYILQKEEVAAVKYITIEDMELIKRKNDSNYTFCNWDDEDFYREINLLKNKRKQILGE